MTPRRIAAIVAAALVVFALVDTLAVVGRVCFALAAVAVLAAWSEGGNAGVVALWNEVKHLIERAREKKS